MVPALVGLAWTDRRPRAPSHLYALCLLGSAGVIAASAVPIAFEERHSANCQPWITEHLVLGVGGFPVLGWDRYELPVGIAAAPVIVPETTLLTLFSPLQPGRC